MTSPVDRVWLWWMQIRRDKHVNVNSQQLLFTLVIFLVYWFQLVSNVRLGRGNGP